jgi:hypothetical protein
MTQVFLVERSIELSNLDDFSDMSRQRLIWDGLEQIESIFNQKIFTLIQLVKINPKFISQIKDRIDEIKKTFLC